MVEAEGRTFAFAGLEALTPEVLETFPYEYPERAAEVLVDGTRFDVIRRRETLEDLLAPERIPASLD